MVPIMYEYRKVKTVPGNKIPITIYSWTVCTYIVNHSVQNSYVSNRVLDHQTKNIDLKWVFFTSLGDGGLMGVRLNC